MRTCILCLMPIKRGERFKQMRHASGQRDGWRHWLCSALSASWSHRLVCEALDAHDVWRECNLHNGWEEDPFANFRLVQKLMKSKYFGWKAARLVYVRTIRTIRAAVYKNGVRDKEAGNAVV